MSDTHFLISKQTDSLTVSDLAFIDAMQENPRASWEKIGSLTGTSAPTARRHWERLTQAGHTWITTHPALDRGVTHALVSVQCTPGKTDEVAARLAQLPRVMSISVTTGDFDLLLTVITFGATELRTVTQQVMGSYPDVVRVRTTLMTRIFRDGSQWRSGALSAASNRPRTLSSAPLSLSTVVRLVHELEVDGRAPASAVGNALGITAAHTRRLISRGIASGQIAQRVDIHMDQQLWPHALALWLVAPAAQLYQTAQRLTELTRTRVCAALAGGAANLYAVVWLRSLAEAPDTEAQLLHGLDARVADRSVLLHYPKRLGHLFDNHRKRIGHVSWAKDITLADALPDNDDPGA